MNILKIKELIKAIRTQEPNSINNVKNTYGELVISCWEQLNPKELNNGSSVGGFASLFVYIESLKVSCMQRLPHGHSKKHAVNLIERLISHLKPENFANQALEYISPAALKPDWRSAGGFTMRLQARESRCVFTRVTHDDPF